MKLFFFSWLAFGALFCRSAMAADTFQTLDNLPKPTDTTSAERPSETPEDRARRIRMRGFGELGSLTVQFPLDRETWIKTPPLTSRGLRGKGVVLYFFEESCPDCNKLWPSLLATSKKFADKPVIFIAVNSGNTKQSLQEYLNSVHCDWPAICDSDRSFEKLCGVSEINLKNNMQLRVVLADGSIENSGLIDLAAAATRAISGTIPAAWRIDPQDIPFELKAAWRAIECGHPSSGLAAIKKASKSSSETVSNAARSLLKAVEADIALEMKEASRLQNEHKRWPAWLAFDRMLLQYKGFEIPDEADNLKRSLALDPDVKLALASIKAFETAAKAAEKKNTPAGLKKLRDTIEIVLEKAPGSDAAARAETIFKHLDDQ